MKIVVFPEKLQELSREFENNANKIVSIENSLRQVVANLDWETRRKANVEGSIRSMQNLSSGLRGESQDMSRFLSTKAQAFLDADRFGYGGIIETIKGIRVHPSIGFPLGKVLFFLGAPLYLLHRKFIAPLIGFGRIIGEQVQVKYFPSEEDKAMFDDGKDVFIRDGLPVIIGFDKSRRMHNEGVAEYLHHSIPEEHFASLQSIEYKDYEAEGGESGICPISADEAVLDRFVDESCPEFKQYRKELSDEDYYSKLYEDKADELWRDRRIRAHLRDTESNIVIYETGTVRNIKTSLSHEVGHNVFKNMSNEQQEGWIRISDNKKYPSVYASGNISEDFAESYRFYLTDPARLKFHDSQRYEFMKHNVFNGREYWDVEDYDMGAFEETIQP